MILQIFSGVGLGQRAAEHGEVLREDEHRPAVDAPGAGDHAVAGDLLLVHAEVVALVHDELVELEEGAGSSSSSRRSRAVGPDMRSTVGARRRKVTEFIDFQRDFPDR